MTLTLTEQLTLLALDDDKGTFTSDSLHFGYGLAGAIILELALRDKIVLEGKKLKLTSGSSCSDTVLDFFLEKISKSKKDKSVLYWVESIGNKLSFVKEQTLEKLIDKGILSKKEEKFLWVIPNDKYPTKNAKPENEVRKRLNKILMSGRKADMQDLMLFALVDMCQMNREVYGKENAKKYKKKIKETIESEVLSTAVGKAVQEIHEILLGIIVMLITTAATSASTGH